MANTVNIGRTELGAVAISPDGETATFSGYAEINGQPMGYNFAMPFKDFLKEFLTERSELADKAPEHVKTMTNEWYRRGVIVKTTLAQVGAA